MTLAALIEFSSSRCDEQGARPNAPDLREHFLWQKSMRIVPRWLDLLVDHEALLVHE